MCHFGPQILLQSPKWKDLIMTLLKEKRALDTTNEIMGIPKQAYVPFSHPAFKEIFTAGDIQALARISAAILHSQAT
jgi:hypothetical protein